MRIEFIMFTACAVAEGGNVVLSETKRVSDTIQNCKLLESRDCALFHKVALITKLDAW